MSKSTSHYISCTKLSNNQREFLLVMVFKPSTMTMKNPKLKFSRNPLFKCVNPPNRLISKSVNHGCSFFLSFDFKERLYISYVEGEMSATEAYKLVPIKGHL